MPTPSSARRGSIKKCQGQGWVCTICPASRTKGQRSFPNFKAALKHERTAHDHDHSASKDEGYASDVEAVRVSENHLPTVDETCWDKNEQPRLTSEGLRQWDMHAHVDHVFDMVPFWRRGIDAAEKGEVLRLEEFLEKMEGDGGWRTANEVLGMLGGLKGLNSERAPEAPVWDRPQDGWAASQRGAWESCAVGWAGSQRGGWHTGSNRIASDATESSRGGWGGREKWAEGVSDLKVGRGGNAGWRAHVKPVGAVDGGGREELHHFVDAIAQQEAVDDERRRKMHLFFEMPMEDKIRKIEETIRFLRTHA